MIGFVVFGLFVGAVARLLVPGEQKLSLAMTLLLGMAGSVVGGVVAGFFGTGSIWELDLIGSVVAVGAAVVFVGAGEKALPRAKRDGRA